MIDFANQPDGEAMPARGDQPGREAPRRPLPGTASWALLYGPPQEATHEAPAELVETGEWIAE